MRKIAPWQPRSRRSAWLIAGVTACLTAACGPAAAGSTAAAAGPTFSAMSAPLNCAPLGVKQPPCYGAAAYEAAYGVAPLLSHGIDGRGEAVAMPELAAGPGSTDIRKDLAAFDHRMGLPTATLRVVNIAQSKTPYLAQDEEVEDTEMVHAIAPRATLDVVLLPQDTTSSSGNFTVGATRLVQASVAVHAAVISISASVGEHFVTAADVSAMNAALARARRHDITVVAASGDTGAISDDGPPRQVSLPASDPLVLAVVGTILDASYRTGAYHGEMAWNGGTDASGGYSSLFGRPAYQNGAARARAGRGVPDVAANADSGTAMAIEYSNGELRPATGTSASTPLWAGVIALADHEAGRHLGFVNPAIYAIGRGLARHRAFHDVVTGDNRCCGPPASSSVTPPDPAGTQSPAGAVRTPGTSSRCWHTRPGPC